jgi:hypothetical protein
MAIVAVAALGNSGSSSLALPCCRSCSSSTALRGPFQPLGNTQVQDELRRVHRQAASLPRRVEAVSELFLGTPYKLDALGEGPDGEFDRDPLIRFDAFDCTTFVETVMALSLESDLESAARTLQKIRYKDGQIGYATRNHITELDWVPNNVRAGYLRDITSEVAGRDAIEMSKTVSKRDWLRKSMVSFEGQFSEEEKRRLLPKLQALGERFRDERATLTVLPVHALPRAMARIPSGTIANLVRADQPGEESIVSHQVLLIKKNDGWCVRHAASGKIVEDDPIFETFARYKGSSWPLIGLNLNLLREPKSAEAPR